MHVNAQAEGNPLASATGDTETHTAVAAELNEAESPGTASPIREKTDISLPSARRLTVRRSRRTRRNIHTSVGDTRVEIVVQGCEASVGLNVVSIASTITMTTSKIWHTFVPEH